MCLKVVESKKTFSIIYFPREPSESPIGFEKYLMNPLRFFRARSLYSNLVDVEVDTVDFYHNKSIWNFKLFVNFLERQKTRQYYRIL